MKQILLMRHAKSSWENEGLSDHDRPLNDRGARAALAMGQFLLSKNLVPQQVLSSDSVRTRQTIEHMQESWNEDVAVEFRTELYLASAKTYRDVIKHAKPGVETLMILGHNPGMESLVSRLSNVEQHFPTAAIAVIKVDVGELFMAGTRMNQWQFEQVLRPKELGID
ncbi:MAG: histidine phosphatase family protein [Pirellulaceae bacterium]